LTEFYYLQKVGVTHEHGGSQSIFEKFDKTYWTSHNQPTLKQLDHMHDHVLKGGPIFLKWFQQDIIYLFVLFIS
jgi:hypothetical protein